MILMIDNYDSFTYNIVQYLLELGAEIDVRRNDEINLDDIAELNPEKIVISPGPCTPNEAGISMACIERFSGTIPILGICLGHQSIGQVFGGQVVRAREVMHGKTSVIHHNQGGVFTDLAQPLPQPAITLWWLIETAYPTVWRSLPGQKRTARSMKLWDCVTASMR